MDQLLQGSKSDDAVPNTKVTSHGLKVMNQELIIFETPGLFVGDTDGAKEKNNLIKNQIELETLKVSYATKN